MASCLARNSETPRTALFTDDTKLEIASPSPLLDGILAVPLSSHTHPRFVSLYGMSSFSFVCRFRYRENEVNLNFFHRGNLAE